MLYINKLYAKYIFSEKLSIKENDPILELSSVSSCESLFSSLHSSRSLLEDEQLEHVARQPRSCEGKSTRNRRCRSEISQPEYKKRTRSYIVSPRYSTRAHRNEDRYGYEKRLHSGGDVPSRRKRLHSQEDDHRYVKRSRREPEFIKRRLSHNSQVEHRDPCQRSLLSGISVGGRVRKRNLRSNNDTNGYYICMKFVANI